MYRKLFQLSTLAVLLFGILVSSELGTATCNRADKPIQVKSERVYEADVLITIPTGQIFVITELVGHWWTVQYRNTTGYMYQTDVEYVSHCRHNPNL